MSRPEGDSNAQPSNSCRMLWPFELSGPDICCPLFLNSSSGGINIFEVKLTFEMWTVRGQQHSFSTHERVFLWMCQNFWDRKYFVLKGSRTPNYIYIGIIKNVSFFRCSAAAKYFAAKISYPQLTVAAALLNFAATFLSIEGDPWILFSLWTNN